MAELKVKTVDFANVWAKEAIYTVPTFVGAGVEGHLFNEETGQTLNIELASHDL